MSASSAVQRVAAVTMGRRTSVARIAVVGMAFASIPLIGYIDGHSSAYIAFSIFYVVPIALIGWIADRPGWSVAAVVASATAGLVADLWTIHVEPVYAYVNVVSRLALFSVIAWTIARLRRAIERERDTSEMRRQLMHRVATDVREPLGEIYARVVDLGFDAETLSSTDLRDLVARLAEASQRATRLVDSLALDDSSALSLHSGTRGDQRRGAPTGAAPAPASPRGERIGRARS